jgi:hypothetical protein
MGYLKAFLQISPGENEKNHENSISIAGSSANITTFYRRRGESVRSTSVRSKRQGDQRGWEGSR